MTTDAQSDERFAGGGSVVAMGIRSAMAAPLWHGDSVTGLIYVDTALKAAAFNQDDVDLLSALANHLAVAIEQSQLQQAVLTEELIRRRLERYHSPAVVERISKGVNSADDGLVADEREATVLFADLVGFTNLCEGMSPREVVELLNHYFSELTEVIFRHEGTVDKFIGDCIMAVFGAPIASEDHAQRACDAALEMRQALGQLNDALPGDIALRFRVGIHTGKVVAGDIGSVRRSDYTVLGATVNLAARIESAVALPDQIMISDITKEGLPESYLTKFAGDRELKGIKRRVPCYELQDQVHALRIDGGPS
jgi:adenylate cyclase